MVAAQKPCGLLRASRERACAARRINECSVVRSNQSGGAGLAGL